MLNELRVGVVGYSSKQFDLQLASQLIKNAFDKVDKEYANHKKIIISGLTDLGIPSLAYKEACKRRWKTIGIACSKATEHKCFPVDKKIIVGTQWGEESATFLDLIDILIRVGGGEQAKKETDLMKKKGKLVIEYDLVAQD
ncbi:MAG: hypothetical protein WAQ98_09630 [Blastocatellia bacterium]